MRELGPVKVVGRLYDKESPLNNIYASRWVGCRAINKRSMLISYAPPAPWRGRRHPGVYIGGRFLRQSLERTALLHPPRDLDAPQPANLPHVHPRRGREKCIFSPQGRLKTATWNSKPGTPGVLRQVLPLLVLTILIFPREGAEDDEKKEFIDEREL